MSQDDLMEVIAEVRSMYAKRGREWAERLRGMQDERDLLRDSLRSLNGRAKQLEDSLAVITNQREGELKERDDLRDRLARRDDRIECLEAELSRLRSERSALKAACKAAAEALEPFAHPDLNTVLPGNANAGESPVFGRNKAMLRIKDFERAAFTHEKLGGRFK